MLFGGMNLEIYDEAIHRSHLEEFFKKIDVENNSSIAHLGIHIRPNVQMFLMMVDDKIINMNYVHDFSEYYPNAFRVLTRTATLPLYRSYGFPRQRSLAGAVGLASYSVPYQIEFAKEFNAEHFLFTTNEADGAKSSQRMGELLKKLEPVDPRFSYYDEREIYGCRQIVWKLNFADIINLNDPLDP